MTLSKMPHFIHESWRATHELRYKKTVFDTEEKVRTVSGKEALLFEEGYQLQQAWQNTRTGEIEWREIERVD